MAERASKAVNSRKDYYDRNSVERSIAVRDLVLYRTPGLNCKLAEVWKNPYVVLEKLSLVNYRVRDNEEGKALWYTLMLLKSMKREKQE